MKGSYVQPEIDWNSMSAAPVGVIQRSRKAKASSDGHETLQHEGYLDSELNWLCGDPTLIARPGFIASSGSASRSNGDAVHSPIRSATTTSSRTPCRERDLFPLPLHLAQSCTVVTPGNHWMDFSAGAARCSFCSSTWHAVLLPRTASLHRRGAALSAIRTLPKI